jgi:hypothetical protein
VVSDTARCTGRTGTGGGAGAALTGVAMDAGGGGSDGGAASTGTVSTGATSTDVASDGCIADAAGCGSSPPNAASRRCTAPPARRGAGGWAASGSDGPSARPSGTPAGSTSWWITPDGASLLTTWPSGARNLGSRQDVRDAVNASRGATGSCGDTTRWIAGTDGHSGARRGITTVGCSAWLPRRHGHMSTHPP